MNPAQHLLDREELFGFLATLIRTPSVFLPGVEGANEAAVAQIIVDQLRAWGLDPLVEEVAPGRPNIVCDLIGSQGDGPLLLFEGHTDVVTPGDRAQWRYDPFGAEVVDGRMYGRGSADMKGGLAAMIYALRALQLAGAPFCGRIRLLIPVDEEGLMIGIKHMVAAGHANGAIGAIICEPEEREICLASKGALRLRLISYGRIAHGAMPEEGVNALTGLVRLLALLLDLEAELQAAHGSHPLLGKFYLSPTIARAPLSGDTSQLNCLPDQADAFLDIRTIPAIAHSWLITQIRERMAQVQASHPQARFEVEVIDDRPAVEIAAEHPIVQALVAAHQQIYRQEPPWGGVPGSTDGTIIARDAGVPVVVYGPGHKRIPHQPNEFVELAEVEQATRVYIEVVLRILGASS
ncbi:MAG: M20 family metallopeptidase [Roseiflexaceae bacterium]